MDISISHLIREYVHFVVLSIKMTTLLYINTLPPTYKKVCSQITKQPKSTQTPPTPHNNLDKIKQNHTAHKPYIITTSQTLPQYTQYINIPYKQTNPRPINANKQITTPTPIKPQNPTYHPYKPHLT